MKVPHETIVDEKVLEYISQNPYARPSQTIFQILQFNSHFISKQKKEKKKKPESLQDPESSQE